MFRMKRNLKNIEGWDQKSEESEEKEQLLLCFILGFLLLVLCQNNYLCYDNVIVQSYDWTNFLSNLCDSLKVTKAKETSK